MSAAGGFPRLRCPGCGRQVAAANRAPFVSPADKAGYRHEYAYLRRHLGVRGRPCPVNSVILATVLTPARPAPPAPAWPA